jgi:short-subunit dehydrogenase
MGDPFLEKYGPWALVGGSCQGIGLALARELAGRGFSLLLLDLREDLLPGVEAELRARHGVETRGVRLDLGGSEAGERLRGLAAECEIGLGFACAAIGGVGPFLSEPLEAHRARVAVNCGGALALAHALAPPMVARGRGGLVFFGSMAGLQGTGWVASYAATKSFDLVLAEGLWYELRPHGVDVLAIVPGSTDTPGMRSSQPRGGARGWQSAEEVAREALEALGREPVHVSGEANRKVVAALDRLPRAQRLQAMGDSMRALYED